MTEEKTVVTIEERVRLLARDQKELAEKESKLAELRSAFDAQHADLISEISARREDVSKTDAALRAAALEQYAETGNKKPHPAVGIRVTKKSEYDEKSALEYAKTKRPDWIVLDSKAYAKALTESGRDPEMPGDVVEVPTATVSKDLSEYAG